MRGFTILELVCVMAILGILAITAMTTAPSPKPARLTAAAKQVQADIEYAKQNAMMSGVTSGVRFRNNQYYTVYENTDSTPLANPLTKSSMIITLSTSYPGVGITRNFTVEFDSFGAPTTGGGGYVTISDGTTTKTITVSANTGLVSIS